MMPNLFTRVVVGAFVVVLLLLGYTQLRARSANARADQAALRADSIAAIADTTRAVGERALSAARKMYGDSILAVERRSLQIAPQLDRLDKALDRITAANVSLTAQVRTLSEQVGGITVTQDSAGVRSATIPVSQEPFSGTIAVSLPAPPASGTASLNVAVAPAAVGIRVQCGAAVGGIRPATILATTPAWLTMKIDSVRQSPDVCNPPESRHWYQNRLVLGPAYTVYMDADHTIKGALGISGSLAVFRWP